MKGFTLMEVLVTVLIVGILAGIAVPQYKRAVEKSRLAEAVIIAKSIVEAQNRSLASFPDEPVTRQGALDVKLSGGSWSSDAARDTYTKGNFSYPLHADGVKIVREGQYTLFMGNNDAAGANWCTGDICSSIRGIGFDGTAPNL